MVLSPTSWRWMLCSLIFNLFSSLIKIFKAIHFQLLLKLHPIWLKLLLQLSWKSSKFTLWFLLWNHIWVFEKGVFLISKYKGKFLGIFLLLTTSFVVPWSEHRISTFEICTVLSKMWPIFVNASMFLGISVYSAILKHSIPFLLLFSHSVLSCSLQLHELYTRLPHPFTFSDYLLNKICSCSNLLWELCFLVLAFVFH